MDALPPVAAARYAAAMTLRRGPPCHRRGRRRDRRSSYNPVIVLRRSAGRRRHHRRHQKLRVSTTSAGSASATPESMSDFLMASAGLLGSFARSSGLAPSPCDNPPPMPSIPCPPSLPPATSAPTPRRLQGGLRAGRRGSEMPCSHMYHQIASCPFRAQLRAVCATSCHDVPLLGSDTGAADDRGSNTRAEAGGGDDGLDDLAASEEALPLGCLLWSRRERELPLSTPRWTAFQQWRIEEDLMVIERSRSS
ncbi:hypothetical protein ZWY2020_048343 [Hordeum vulgare]|nr:hypothetical protein ZWY2020_048343 [Hordeum vulgare]